MRNSRLPFLGLLALFTACSAQPISAERQKSFRVLSAVSFLGDELVANVVSRQVMVPKEQSLDVAAWKTDEVFRDLLADGAKARGKEFLPFSLDPTALGKALGAREGRWKRIAGKYNQALLDLLFRSAEAQGIEAFFLITASETNEKFPFHKGNKGISCQERNSQPRAYAYFNLDFSYWSVSERKRLFRQIVEPEFTQDQLFAECREVADLKDPLEALREPVQYTMAKVVEKLFLKMGWEKPAE